ESGHESSHDQRYRVNIGARKEHQQPLPNDLIKQGREPRDKENDEGDRTIPRRARLAGVHIVWLSVRNRLVLIPLPVSKSAEYYLFAARWRRTNSAIGKSRG